METEDIQNRAQLAPKVKADQKMSKDDLPHNTANSLATILSPRMPEVNQSHMQELETSTATTASSRGTGSQKSSRSSQITGLQQLHQLTSVPAATVESLADCLKSVDIAAEDHSANMAVHQMGVAIQLLASDNKSHLS